MRLSRRLLFLAAFLPFALPGEVVITEFMASNTTTLADEDGDFSDWIEITNTGNTTIDLRDYLLTDEANFDVTDPTSVWAFPTRFLGAGQHLIVFASGKHRAPGPVGELHTHFQLASSGEYLALIAPDGTTRLSEFAPAYPEQRTDVSYGRGQADLGEVRLVAEGDQAAVHIPLNDSVGLAWIGGDEPFDDAAWTRQPTGLGFDRKSGSGGFILVEDFDSLLPEGLDGQNGWTAPFPTVEVTNDPDNAENQAMRHAGSGAYASRPINLPAWVQATVFFRLRRDGTPDFGAGVSDLASGATWSDFEAMVNVQGDATLKARDGSLLRGVAELENRTWYNLWMVIDNPNDRFQLYLQGGAYGEQIMLTDSALSEFGFRNGAAANPMRSFLIRSGLDTDGSVMIDDIYFSLRENLGNPVEALGLGHLVAAGGDLEDTMWGINSSVYARIPFPLPEMGALSALTLRMRYDDGFVAYLNGTEVARRAAPLVPLWNSVAATSRTTAEALVFENIDILSFQDLLRSNEDNLLCIHGLNTSAEDDEFLLTPELIARQSDATPAMLYFTTATPGSRNAEGYLGLLEDTRFSIDRGFYEAPFEVVISTKVPGTTIVYTTDGSTPTTTHGTPAPAPVTVPISTTTTLRAFAMKSRYRATNVDTHTYLFLDDVVQQGNTPEGYPTTWLGDGGRGTLPADYEMDPEVTNDPRYKERLDDALRAIPTISIVTDKDHFFDASTGILLRAQKSGPAWERPISFEIIDPSDPSRNFQVDAGIRMQGGHTRIPSKNAKHSFRVLFKSIYGASKLRYDLFPDDPTAAKEFDQLILRGFGNQSWLHHNTFKGTNRERAQYIRDNWAKDVQLAMGHPGLRNLYAHLYINGLYWGLFNPTERATAGWAESYLGGEKEDIASLNSGEAIDGNTARAEYDALFALVNGGLTSAAAYTQIQELLDLEAFTDYMLIRQYGADLDWDHHNWYAVRNTQGGKWYFLTWDAEFIFIDPNDNVLELDNDENPSRIWNRLMENEDYRVFFADRVQKHCFNGGLLTPEGVLELWERRSEEVFLPLIAESARWGDYRRDVLPWGLPTPIPLYDPEEEWMAERNRLLTTYFPERTNILLEQYRAKGAFPETEAPTYSQASGGVPVGYALGIEADEGSTVYYTTDGSDPRQSVESINPLLIAAEDAMRALVPMDNSLGTAWRGGAEPFDDSSWQSGFAVGYERTPDRYDGLYDINVQSAMDGGNPSCFIRLKFNLTADALERITRLNLAVQYDDGFVAFLNGEQVLSDRAPSMLNWNSEATSGHADIVAVLFANFSLAGDQLDALQPGENVLAIHGLNTSPTSSDFLFNLRLTADTLGSVTPSDTAQAFEAPITVNGPVQIRARAVNNSVWSALAEAVLTTALPAAADNFVISEIMYNPNGPDETEFLELLNIAPETIDLGGLRFSEGLDFEFPLGTLVDPAGRVLLVRDPVAFEAQHGAGLPVRGGFANDTALDNGGERLTLTTADGTVVRSFEYDDDAPWPIDADGGGYSLVLVNPFSNPDHGLAQSWQRSPQAGGTPGTSDGPGFSGDPSADDDDDSAPALLEYALGTSDSVAGDLHGAFSAAHAKDVWTMGFLKNNEATDVRIEVFQSDDLKIWHPASEVLELQEQTPVGETQTRFLFRLLDPASSERFFRIEALQD